MNETPSIGSLLLERASRQKRRIGIGLTAPTDAIVEGLQKARSFCEPVLYGAAVPGFTSFASADPADALLGDLERGAIDAAVRGQISAFPFRKRFDKMYGGAFRPTDMMITVLEFPGNKTLIVSPPSNVTTGTLKEKIMLVDASIVFCRMAGLPISIGVLAQCRQGDLPDFAGTELEQSYKVAEQVVERYKDRYIIKNYGIDFEKAFEDGVTILIEPNGTTGNQVIRTLYFLGVVRFYGGPYMGAKHVVVETFRNAADFPDVLMMAGALCNSRDDGEKGKALCS